MGNIQSFQEHFSDQIASIQNPSAAGENGISGILDDFRQLLSSSSHIRFTPGSPFDSMIENNVGLLVYILHLHKLHDLIPDVLKRKIKSIDFDALIQITHLLTDEKEEFITSWIVENPKRGYQSNFFTEDIVAIICNEPLLVKHLLFSKKNIETIFKTLGFKKYDENYKIADRFFLIQHFDNKIISALEKERMISRFMIFRTEEELGKALDMTESRQQEILEAAAYFLPERTNYFVREGLSITEDFIEDLLSSDMIKNILYLYHFNFVTSKFDKIIRLEIQIIDSNLCQYIVKNDLDQKEFKCSICLEDHVSQIQFSCPENAECPAAYCLPCADKCKFTCATCKRSIIIANKSFADK